MKKNCSFKTGLTLPCQVNFKAGVDISGFFGIEFKKEDSEPRLYTCTDKNFVILKSDFILLMTALQLNRVTL
jgi:hypothetical protein